ncbi:MAG: D-alanine--D-alanine ligase family protein [Solirubrobacteraceae bacterium]
MSLALVAMGGSSLEREISLRSGHRVERALRTLGHRVRGLDVDARFIEGALELRPSFVFIAMHGRGGEDGTLQELLETLSVPYTGSDALASALCMDKVLFKRMLVQHGLPTPAFHSFSETAFREMGGAGTFPRLLEQLGLPVVVKPVAQGSAIGIRFVETPQSFASAILGAFGYGDRVLVERRVLGRELAVTVLGPPERCRALPIVELSTPGDFYSYEAHYTIGGVRLQAPAQLPEHVRARVEELALASYRLLGCRDFARVDIVLDEHELPHVLEINTIPGLTETGITPAAAEAAGMRFTELVAEIVSRVAS